MRIAIAGTGMVGQFYGRRWVAAGHQVTFTHARDHATATTVAKDVGAVGFAPTLDGAEFDAVLLAARLEALDDARAALGACADTVLMDAVNPFTPSRDGLVDLGGGTAATEVAKSFPHARHVKAFHSIGVQRVLDAPDQQVAVFIAGDDSDANQLAMGLARDAGLSPVMTGGLETAALSEPPGPLFSQAWTAQQAADALEAHRG